jgi:hypothetical protein
MERSSSMVKSKQISDQLRYADALSAEIEEKIFQEVQKTFEFKDECIIEFFGNFLDIPNKDLKGFERVYKTIAKKMFPLEA